MIRNFSFRLTWSTRVTERVRVREIAKKGLRWNVGRHDVFLSLWHGFIGDLVCAQRVLCPSINDRNRQQSVRTYYKLYRVTFYLPNRNVPVNIRNNNIAHSARSRSCVKFTLRWQKHFGRVRARRFGVSTVITVWLRWVRSRLKSRSDGSRATPLSWFYPIRTARFILAHRKDEPVRADP
jgi:hypothetical protein